MADTPNKSDSPKVTQQAALTTSSGRIWLVIGGILAVISLGFLWQMREIGQACPFIEPAPPGCGDGRLTSAPLIGIAIIVLLYAAMVVVRFTVERLRVRLAVMAILTALIPITFVICGGIVILAQQPPIPLPVEPLK
ncbi:hypothetical protein [Diaminobutyricimonas sp. TR449]|uniref:hypothetical protein n=1 Tax=Diaminobutyricimonas sp. TR449 TaxID=2708076 RepID=UPI0014227834|nr:hypothetical protein [Diaminobutyricimonas sp. TR449]